MNASFIANTSKAISKFAFKSRFLIVTSSKMSSLSPDKTVLYSYWHSSCSFRVRIALNLKKVPYALEVVSLLKSQQNGNDYQVINPMRQVPALRIDGHTLIESVSIMHYLEETRSQQPLLPQDAYKRAKVREICEMITAGIQPLQNLCVRDFLDSEKKEGWAEHWINRGFCAVEEVLSKSAGKYCVGDEITMADCCLIPQVFSAKRFHVDLQPYPTILRIDRELESNPAFIAAHPFNQPDCPPKPPK